METHTHYPLNALNTFQVTATAERYVRFDQMEEIQHFLESNDLSQTPYLILGGGSNLLFVGDVAATVLHPVFKGMAVVRKDAEHVWVRVMAGEVWDDFVAFAVAEGWGGIENLSLIPGNVGASAVQNIGAYGVEVETVIERVEALTFPQGKAVVFQAGECGFGYRESHFKSRWPGRHLITAIVFKLLRQPRFSLSYSGVQKHLDKIGPPTLENIRQAVIDLRRSKLPDPMVMGNAGSFFKNPSVDAATLKTLLAEHPALPHYPQGDAGFKLAAGWLIDQCGWKGKVRGNAAVHDQQALVLVNRGRATGEEILRLSREIEQSIQERFGVRLEREVQVVRGEVL
jgi:UDP-N-acetylmuramate dehydrogenase